MELTITQEKKLANAVLQERERVCLTLLILITGFNFIKS